MFYNWYLCISLSLYLVIMFQLVHSTLQLYVLLNVCKFVEIFKQALSTGVTEQLVLLVCTL